MNEAEVRADERGQVIAELVGLTDTLKEESLQWPFLLQVAGHLLEGRSPEEIFGAHSALSVMQQARMAALLEDESWTYDDLAGAFDVSKSTVKNYLSRYRKVGRKRHNRICSGCGVDFEGDCGQEFCTEECRHRVQWQDLEKTEQRRQNWRASTRRWRARQAAEKEQSMIPDETTRMTYAIGADWLEELATHADQHEHTLRGIDRLMMHRIAELLKADPCLYQLQAGEPSFVLRAHDALAPLTVAYWAELASAGNVHEPAKIAEAAECATAMAHWHQQHAKP